MTTLLLYDPLCLTHETGDRPECPARLEVTVEELKKQGAWERCEHAPARDATLEELTLVHTPAYIEEVRRLAQQGGGLLDPDTIVSPGSYDAAVRAVGLVLQGADWILAGRARNGFALVRPPGHHAFPDRGTGFCIFNNVAIAARYLRRKKNVERVLIVDWDVHHGNGTQEVFYDDPTVMYVSAHAFPFYPGTGAAHERGAGDGEGYTLNIPMTPGTLPDLYVGRFCDAVRGAAREFRPEFLLVSAGFDAVTGDPVGVLDLPPETYRSLTQLVKDLAEEGCGGRLLSVLEGGYSLSLLPHCVTTHVYALMGTQEPAKEVAESGSGTSV
jgi:acetoin utilization deacetylase AcuC-like enzyme